MKMKKKLWLCQADGDQRAVEGQGQALRAPWQGSAADARIQAVAYEAQLKFKENLIENHLRRIGGFSEIPMEPIVGMEYPYRYRNKAQFPMVGRTGTET